MIVRGPPWMPIEQVSIYLNGELAHQEELPPPPADPYSTLEQVHRVRFPLSVPDDSFITVEAGDRLERLGESAPHDGPLGRAFPLLRVLAFTNPLLVDPEGDGSVWDREQGAAARTASAAR